MTSVFYRALILVLGGAAGACGGLSTEANKELSSGYTGCRPGEITISEEQGHEIETWVAECRGRKFHCVRGGGIDFICSLDYQATSGGEQ